MGQIQVVTFLKPIILSYTSHMLSHITYTLIGYILAIIPVAFHVLARLIQIREKEANSDEQFEMVKEKDSK